MKAGGIPERISQELMRRARLQVLYDAMRSNPDEDEDLLVRPSSNP